MIRRFIFPLFAIAAALAMPLVVVAQSGGLSAGRLSSHDWTCFNVPGLGVHCSPPGQEWPPTGPTSQLLYFFNTTDPQSDVPDFTGIETLLQDAFYHNQPCPSAANGKYTFIGDLGGGVGYWACHRS